MAEEKTRVGLEKKEDILRVKWVTWSFVFVDWQFSWREGVSERKSLVEVISGLISREVVI